MAHPVVGHSWEPTVNEPSIISLIWKSSIFLFFAEHHFSVSPKHIIASSPRQVQEILAWCAFRRLSFITYRHIPRGGFSQSLLVFVDRKSIFQTLVRSNKVSYQLLFLGEQVLKLFVFLFKITNLFVFWVWTIFFVAARNFDFFKRQGFEQCSGFLRVWWPDLLREVKIVKYLLEVFV